MKLLERFRAWLNDPISEVVGTGSKKIAVILNSSLDTEVNTKHIAESIVKLANACESLERTLSDRMDIIEGQLEEMKPKEPGQAVSVGGHKRWTARRDERVAKHFNRSDFVAKLQKVTTEVANG